MSGPARTGILFYAKDLLTVSTFYEQVLGAKVLKADDEHRVLLSPDVQLIIHAVPPQYRSAIVIEVPPVARETQAIKPFFTVADSLRQKRSLKNMVAGYGGRFGMGRA